MDVTWPDLLSCRWREFITDHEDRINKLLHALERGEEPKYPRVAWIFDARNYQMGIYWWTEDGERKLFLLRDCDCSDAEDNSYLNCKVAFIGTADELRRSKLVKKMNKIRSVKSDIVVVLVNNGKLKATRKTASNRCFSSSLVAYSVGPQKTILPRSCCVWTTPGD